VEPRERNDATRQGREDRSPVVGPVVSAARWALRTTWETSPGLSVACTVFAVLRTVAPAGIALVARGLINVVIHGRAEGTGATAQLWSWLAPVSSSAPSSP
jgi:hypothetical protein